jgi:hypothetical protein
MRRRWGDSRYGGTSLHQRQRAARAEVERQLTRELGLLLPHLLYTLPLEYSEASDGFSAGTVAGAGYVSMLLCSAHVVGHADKSAQALAAFADDAQGGMEAAATLASFRSIRDLMARMLISENDVAVRSGPVMRALDAKEQSAEWLRDSEAEEGSEERLALQGSAALNARVHGRMESVRQQAVNSIVTDGASVAAIVAMLRGVGGAPAQALLVLDVAVDLTKKALPDRMRGVKTRFTHWWQVATPATVRMAQRALDTATSALSAAPDSARGAALAARHPTQQVLTYANVWGRLTRAGVACKTLVERSAALHSRCLRLVGVYATSDDEETGEEAVRVAPWDPDPDPERRDPEHVKTMLAKIMTLETALRLLHDRVNFDPQPLRDRDTYDAEAYAYQYGGEYRAYSAAEVSAVLASAGVGIGVAIPPAAKRAFGALLGSNAGRLAALVAEETGSGAQRMDERVAATAAADAAAFERTFRATRWYNVWGGMHPDGSVPHSAALVAGDVTTVLGAVTVHCDVDAVVAWMAKNNTTQLRDH